MPQSAPLTTSDSDVRAVLDWWDVNGRVLPWRATRDIYGVWVSEVMSAQTSVDRAAEAWTRWMRRWPTVEDLASAPLHEVLVLWQGLGYPRRARDLHRSSRIIVDSGWPEDLTRLPGVGPYVDAAIRCFAREEPVLPVDVNVRRVLARRFPEAIDSSGDPWRTGQAIMEFGQRICRPAPLCGVCPVAAGCAGPVAGNLTAKRRQAPYRGSVRERRGRLLRQVLSEGPIAMESADGQAAWGLVADGLVLCDGTWLRAPDR
jgi:A/G-specific adenine glycosylase